MKRIVFLLGGLFLGTLDAFPPPVPSAGVVEREIEKEYEAKPLEPDKEVPVIQIDIPQEKLDLPKGRKVFVKEIVFRGNQSLSEKELFCVVEPWMGRELALADIYSLCEAIERYYAVQGYFLARAYPPPQTIANGFLTIEVIEGKLGNLRVEGNRYYSESVIRSYFAGLQGRPLRYSDFVRALILLNENSDLQAGAIFEKGKEFGCADVIVRIVDAWPAHLYLNGNNYGRNLTTNARAGARFDLGNFAVEGDKVSVAEVVGFPVDALYFTDVIYRVPVNRKGTFVEGAFLFSQFKIEELTALHLKGRSQIATVKASHAMVRTKPLSVDFFGYFDYKQIQNFALGQRTSFDKLRVLTAGFTIDHFSASQGRDYLNLRLAAGIPDFLGGLRAIDSECSRIGGGGRFFYFRGDYDRVQRLPKDCFLYLHGSAQLSPSKLTLPEQIYIGGADTVRGFPLAFALGDSGYYANVEFRFPPPFLAGKKILKVNKHWKDVLQFDAFLDSGGVFLHSEGRTFLWGAGAGARVYGPFRFTLSFDLGVPLNYRDSTNGVFTYIKLTCPAF